MIAHTRRPEGEALFSSFMRLPCLVLFLLTATLAVAPPGRALAQNRKAAPTPPLPPGPDKESLTFLRDMMAGDGARYYHLHYQVALGELYKDTAAIFSDPIFSEIDRRTMREQLAAAAAYEWRAGQLRGATVLGPQQMNKYFASQGSGQGSGTSEEWKAFRKKVDEGYEALSIPLFSYSKQWAIVGRVSRCGPGCGRSQTSLYRRSGNAWRLEKHYRRDKV